MFAHRSPPSRCRSATLTGVLLLGGYRHPSKRPGLAISKLWAMTAAPCRPSHSGARPSLASTATAGLGLPRASHNPPRLNRRAMPNLTEPG